MYCANLQSYINNIYYKRGSVICTVRICNHTLTAYIPQERLCYMNCAVLQSYINSVYTKRGYAINVRCGPAIIH